VAKYILKQYCGTCVTCGYATSPNLRGPHVHGELVDTVNTAISRVVSLSPTLQVGISAEQSSKPVWIDLGNVDLSKHIEWTSLESFDYKKSIQEKVLPELDKEFFKPDSRPGWRVVGY